jgi:exosortase K
MRVAAIIVALGLVVAGKTYYRHASADDLAWLLSPTALCVSAATDTHFVRERGIGWIDRDVAFEIVPECAGLHFLLCALLVLVVAALPAMTSWPATARHVGIAIAAAYAATIIVNTTRIAIAVRMHERAVGGADLHRLEGTVVYLGGLCALYAMARRLYASPTT